MTQQYTNFEIPIPQIGDAKLEVPDGAVIVGFLRKSDGGRWVIWRDMDANLMLAASDIEDWDPIWIPQEGIHAAIDCTKAEKMFVLALRQEYPVECRRRFSKEDA